MQIALFAGPGVALLGIVAVFFVLRRKSVEKRSMYSARRSQIEHKVRAARQRTLTPHGRAERPAEVAATAAAPVDQSIFAPAQAATPTVIYEPSAFAPPPPAVMPPPPVEPAPESAPASPWDVTAPTAPEPFAVPQAEPQPYQPEPFSPPAEPAYRPPEPSPAYQPAYQAPSEAPPSEPAWTPGPAPSEPASPLEPLQPATTSAGGPGWSVVSSESKPSADAEPHDGKKKDKKAATGSSWMLASGDTPGTEAADDDVKKPSPLIAIAQYAVLVVGLVMVLVGVLVMVANSHVT